MGLTRIVPADASARTVAALGLDASTLDLSSVEVVAALLRRAASFQCPTQPYSLVRAVIDTLRGLPESTAVTEDMVRQVVDELVAYGDLLEIPHKSDDGTTRRVLVCGPPAFTRATDRYFIRGIRPDGAPLLSGPLREYAQYEAHVRFLAVSGNENIAKEVESAGLAEVSWEQWLNEPARSTPEALIAEYNRRLDGAGAAAEIGEVSLLDPVYSVRFYRGRWRPPRAVDTGRFLARRPQLWGARSWCYLELHTGAITRLIDLPVQSPWVAGRDEAWRLQAALDVTRGNPQQVRVREANHTDSVVLEFFSPLPSWAQRRLDLVGVPLTRSKGALFSYRVSRAELNHLLTFLQDMAWISPTRLNERGANGR